MTTTLKLWIATSLVVVFFAGAALGVFAGARHARQLGFVRHGGQMPDRMRRHLQHQLDLTPEQSRQIAPVVDRLADQLELIRNETSARVAKTMDESHREIAPLLTPEQRERLQQMRRRHGRMLRRHDFGPPHGPH